MCAHSGGRYDVQLTVVEPGGFPTKFAMVSSIEVGRGSNGLALTDPSVSLHHLLLEMDPAGVVVARDLGSTTGTWVNGERLSGPREVRAGDVLQVGRTTITLGELQSGATMPLLGSIDTASLRSTAGPQAASDSSRPAVTPPPPTAGPGPAGPPPPPGDPGSPPAAGAPTPGAAAPAPSASTGSSLPAWLVPAAIVAVLLVAIAIFGVTRLRSTHEIQGSVVVYGVAAYRSSVGADCTTSGGYSDIRYGTPAKISDGSGKILATGSLGWGHNDGHGNCEFSFTLPSVPDADFYTVSVGAGNRGELSFSRTELAEHDWYVGLTLGN